MSLMLKGIDLPAKENEPLKLEIYSDGGVWVGTGSDFECRDNVAVQLKRPHGRLIDADTEIGMTSPFGKPMTLGMALIAAHQYVPTVISEEE